MSKHVLMSEIEIISDGGRRSCRELVEIRGRRNLRVNQPPLLAAATAMEITPCPDYRHVHAGATVRRGWL